MSRWLKSVNTLLDSLDGQVETAIEDHQRTGGTAHGGTGEQEEESGSALLRLSHGTNDQEFLSDQQESIDHILLKRGLLLSTPNGRFAKEEEDDDNKQNNDLDEESQQNGGGGEHEEEQVGVGVSQEAFMDSLEATEEVVVSEEKEEHGTSENEIQFVSLDGPAEMAAAAAAVVTVALERPNNEVETESGDSPDKLTNEEEAPVIQVAKETLQDGGGATLPTPPLNLELESGSVPGSKDAVAIGKEPQSQVSSKLPNEASMEATTSEAPRSVPAPLVKTLEKEHKASLKEAKEAQREARTLRRHVVALNEELEAAEAEVKAQRTELERAAERIEKDRIRNKKDKEKLVSSHADEIKALKAQQEQTLKDQKARAGEQLESARKRMHEMEAQRMQEGSDWTKELEVAVQRQQEATRRVGSLEDEKSTLLAQISTLQAQQAALANRVESLSQTADNALEREREADDRLDTTLSMHARQLTQRQAREAELERTVAELGAALVVARDKEVERLRPQQNAGVSSDSGDLGSSTAKLAAVEDELESVKAQLDIERQRTQTLNDELRDQSRERTEEASLLHARQLQSDRRVEEMSITISRLQTSIRETKRDSADNLVNESQSSTDEKDEQIKSLSEQLIRHQDRLGNTSSEVKALKSRLQAALSRAEQAEQALATTGTDDGIYDTTERAPSSGGMRKRGLSRRDSSGGSIRAAMYLNTSGQEKIAKAIDVVDAFSVETGQYLRYNPLARGFFLLYLLLIHLWTFVLLVFHAHGYEEVHGDFGAGRQLPHGPHALMHQNVPAQNP